MPIPNHLLQNRPPMLMISPDSRKIALGFLVMWVLLLIMIVQGLSRMQAIQKKIEVISNENNVKTELMMAIRHGIYEREVSLRNIVLLDDPFERDEGKNKFNSYAVDIILARNQFARMRLNDKEKALLKEINAAMVQAYHAQINLIDASIYNAEAPITRADLDRAFKTQEIFMGKVKEMIALQKEATQKAVKDAENSYNEAKSSLYILGATELFVGILVAILVIRTTETQTRRVREAMQSIEDANARLEERVAKRTAQLAQARDQALASNKAKDIFLANMSHEVRTPLNIILGYSELLEELVAEDGNQQYLPDLKKISKAAKHQLTLVSTILDIAKIEEGKLEIEAADFEVNQLLTDIEAAVKPLMAKNHNTFVLNGLVEPVCMYSDRTRIQQILLNLLGNAAKFTEQGTVTLTVAVDSDNIIFTVADTGIGIDSEYMNRLFDKFTQADNSTTRKHAGSGLGLSIAKQLSQLLMGDIQVRSEKGKGSTFTLVLPLIYVKDAETTDRSPS